MINVLTGTGLDLGQNYHTYTTPTSETVAACSYEETVADWQPKNITNARLLNRGVTLGLVNPRLVGYP